MRQQCQVDNRFTGTDFKDVLNIVDMIFIGMLIN